MVPDSFHHFSSLPFELRRMIYVYASTPRFVHVQEHTEDKDEFVERFRTTLVPIKLHPSLVHFARHWRHCIPFPAEWWKWHDGRYQTTLERYGSGTTNRQNHQPWETTEDMPDVSYRFLSENPDVAWELLRTSSFYSTAPIPALLHVTRESRQVLIEIGYELAFRTRSCGPQTWFNFKTDVLYVEMIPDRDDRPFHELLSGNDRWDIGQFEPRDLRRVKRLALDSSANFAHFGNHGIVHAITNILELMGSVEELFLEEPTIRFGGSELSRYVQTENNARSLWLYHPVQEVDVLSDFLEDFTVLKSTGYHHEKLRAYKDANMGNGRDYFVDTAREIEQALRSRRNMLVRGSSLAPWKIPQASVVYLIPEWMCRAMQPWRWNLWHRYQFKKEEQARRKAQEEAKRSIDVPRRPLFEERDTENAPPSPFSIAFQDDIEALDDYMGRYDYHNYPDDSYYRDRDWVLSATISPPEI
ncbi:hypothetical protein F5Y08DRAFT_169471 [Xylaria arbuscula]|nr:hypothetical protein F5Y08DRAFT_169471 [Xylaria arbuscula]